MKWLTALLLGGILGIVLPTAIDAREGVWMDNWTGWGTVHPLANSPGLLLSWPVFIGASLAFRTFFNWHSR